MNFPGGKLPNMIVDDGGDATLMIHLGAKAEKDASVLDTPSGSGDEAALKAILKKVLAADPERWAKTAKEIRGVSEETTTGVHRLYPVSYTHLLRCIRQPAHLFRGMLLQVLFRRCPP